MIERGNRWSDRAKTQYTLRVGTDGKRILISRRADDKGLDFSGCPVSWRDIATFVSCGDAESVVTALQGDRDG